jgi:hypothetical protein
MTPRRSRHQIEFQSTTGKPVTVTTEIASTAFPPCASSRHTLHRKFLPRWRRLSILPVSSQEKREVRFGSYATSQSLSLDLARKLPANRTRGPMKQYGGRISAANSSLGARCVRRSSGRIQGKQKGGNSEFRANLAGREHRHGKRRATVLGEAAGEICRGEEGEGEEM